MNENNSSISKNLNLLSLEKSPYLLQHATNPVHWQPWNTSTFERAVEEGKPIFLSIGYATCHWCHVMEHESFVDEEIAEILNTSFISIKVDREERPDIDSVYMEVCQAMNGHGGWPLTVFMTPEKLPFFTGTYFPKEQRGNRPGFKDVLLRISEIWKNEKERVLLTSEQIFIQMKERVSKSIFRPIEKTIFSDSFQYFWNTFDTHFGGFGKSPKFPSPQLYLFLLRYNSRFGTKEALFMVEKTLQSMRIGGMYDHIGGGFHRYSTDREWLVPHFEKMLYDQAMLIVSNAETYFKTNDPFYKTVVKEIVDYLTLKLLSPEGGFYSAEDADSEGEEGKFYVWTNEELRVVLTEVEFQFVVSLFCCKVGGNYIDEQTALHTGNNILYFNGMLSEYAIVNDFELKELETTVEKVRLKLYNHREKRIKPLLDDKILADWNGLTIAALAISGRICSVENYIQLAENAIDFVLTTFVNKQNGMLHRYRDSDVAIEGMLSDYANTAWGLLELYQATGKEKYLTSSVDLVETVLQYFYDSKSHLFFDTSELSEDTMFIRMKSLYDGASPSGNSIFAMVLTKLSIITENQTYRTFAENILSAVSANIESYPLGYAFYLVVADLLQSSSSVAEIIFPSDQYSTTEFDVILRKYSFTQFYKYSAESRSTKKCINALPTLYYCTNFSCLEPIVGQDAIVTFLQNQQ